MVNLQGDSFINQLKNLWFIAHASLIGLIMLFICILVGIVYLTSAVEFDIELIYDAIT